MEEGLADFFPANKPTFRKRAGEVAQVTAEDWQNEHTRRHLESFAQQMEAWRTYEAKLEAECEEDTALFAFVRDLAAHPDEIQSAAELESIMSQLRKKHRLSPSKSKIAHVLKLCQADGTARPHPSLVNLLTKRAVRTSSGVAVITVLTSPGAFSCPKNCHYCPNEPGQPRSYLSTEPAVLRGNQCGWDAARQFWDRARTLKRNGHVVDKIEILVLGGTWSGYDPSYQEEFVRDLFYAANEFEKFMELSFGLPSSAVSTTLPGEPERPIEDILCPIPQGLRERLSLEEEQRLNEDAPCKVIGLTLETRPDYINKYELRRLRRYGCTRVQIGIQHTDDNILKAINRGCSTADAVRAIRLLKDSCFKVDIHLMPDLPGSDVEKDRSMFDTVLRHEGLQADQWKIYPCEVTPFSTIAKWYEEGRYRPYTEGGQQGEIELISMVLQVKRLVYPWIRLNRVVRDIPNPSIIAGNSKTNLRQLLEQASTQMGWACKCMRCREIRLEIKNIKDGHLMVRSYETFGGTEYFISFETEDGRTLFGFLRLRLPKRVTDGDDEEVLKFKSPFPCLQNARTALIRELHVYGMLVSTTEKAKGKEDKRYQHSGFGRGLLLAAEALALCKGFDRMVIIAGVGTRNYYRKFGYSLQDTYMVKSLESNEVKLETFRGCEEHPNIPAVLKIEHWDCSKMPSCGVVKIDQEVVKSILAVAAAQQADERSSGGNWSAQGGARKRIGVRKSATGESTADEELDSVDVAVGQVQWVEQLTLPPTTASEVPLEVSQAAEDSGGVASPIVARATNILRQPATPIVMLGLTAAAATWWLRYRRQWSSPN